jgi:hypothetical protein
MVPHSAGHHRSRIDGVRPGETFADVARWLVIQNTRRRLKPYFAELTPGWAAHRFGAVALSTAPMITFTLGPAQSDQRHPGTHNAQVNHRILPPTAHGP